MFSTGQSVRPRAGRRGTAFSGPVRSFSKVALRPTAKDRFPRRPRQSARELNNLLYNPVQRTTAPPSPAVPGETCFMPRKPPRIVSNLASGVRLLMSSQLSSVLGILDCLAHGSPAFQLWLGTRVLLGYFGMCDAPFATYSGNISPLWALEV